MTDRLALEFISALGMPPPEMIALVAALGLKRCGMAARPITRNERAHAAWNLLDDRALLHDTCSALADHGVSLSLGEGFLISPGALPDSHLRTLDVMARLGAPKVNAISIGGEGEAAIAAFRTFAAQAAERDMTTTVEFLPMLPPATFAQACAFAAACEVDVLVDAMHFFRSGGVIGDLAGSAASIGYVQICDVPMPAILADYGYEAAQERLLPGEGALPLAAFIAALPRPVTIGLEVPLMRRAIEGENLTQLLSQGIAEARRLLAQTD
jgi:sugar phosphate isomerase/epimerase